MKTLIALLLLSSLACAQTPRISTVPVQVKAPGGTQAGVRVWLTGGGGIPGMNEFGVTDEAGEATLHTRRSSFMFVAARRRDCDLKIWGHRKNAGIGGPFQTFQRCRMNLLDLGSTAAPDPASLVKKTPGKARFCFVAEESAILRRTMPLGKVFVTGDWNNFNTKTEDQDPENGARELYDDGALVENSSDDQIGDGVFSRVLDLPPGEHTYVYFVNGIANDGLSFISDPYEEGSRTATARWEREVRFPASVITVTGE